MRNLARLLLVLSFITLLVPSPSYAQGTEWQERRTERFAILYVGGDAAIAEHYAGFVDPIYDEVAAIFGHRTGTPVTLRLYPTLERYYEINPSARSMPGIVAHADFQRREVVVIVPQTESQTPDEVQNNIRHELTHLVIAELSENSLNVGFQEGLAQYVERPSRELESKIGLLQRAMDNDRLLSWSELDDRSTVYQQPEISYPQSLAIVAFLAERYSFAKLQDFLTISARSSGYRSALERTFGATADELERQWREWLPGYLAGGYRRSTLSAYDLSHAELLIQQGRYEEARQELEAVLEWLRTTDQTEVLQRVEQLLERTAQGQQAHVLASDARAALEAGEYDRAAGLVQQAQEAYARLGDPRQAAVLEAYAERVERGRRAEHMLREAEQLAETLNYPRAREAADRAASEYSLLGDRTRVSHALGLRSRIDQRQLLLGRVLLALGFGGVGVSLLRRLQGRESEAW